MSEKSENEAESTVEVCAECGAQRDFVKANGVWQCVVCATPLPEDTPRQEFWSGIGNSVQRIFEDEQRRQEAEQRQRLPLVLTLASIPISMAIIAAIYYLPVDLQRSWADKWMANVSDKLGIELHDFAMTLSVPEELSTPGECDVPCSDMWIKVANTGLKPLGGNERNWDLAISAASSPQVERVSLVRIQGLPQDLQITEVPGEAPDQLRLRFGKFYPEESFSLQVRFFGFDAYVPVKADAVMPVETHIAVTRHSIEAGPLLKTGNLCLLISFVVLLGVLLVVHSDLIVPDTGSGLLDISASLLLLMSFGSVAIINAVALTKLVLLAQWAIS